MIDPRISLGVKTLNVGNIFKTALDNVKQQDSINSSKASQPLIQAQNERINQLGVASQQPKLQNIYNTQALSLAKGVAIFANSSLGLDSQTIITKALQAKDIAVSHGLDGSIYQNIIDHATNDPATLQKQLQDTVTHYQQFIQNTGTGHINTEQLKQQQQAKDMQTVKNDLEGLTPEGRAAGIRLGLIAKVHNTEAERIAINEALAIKVANSKELIAQAKAKGKTTGKLTAQLFLLPKVKAAVKKAEAIAKEQGLTFNKLAQLKSQLPVIRQTVEDLNKLALTATYSLGGRAYDTIIKETGFGATKGATSRAKYLAIVNNQILPLLRQTFGAQFTDNEGKRLMSVLGDINATPEAKKAELDAFITLKKREIEAELNKEKLLNKGTDTAKTTTGTDIAKMTPEQLQALRMSLENQGIK